MHKRNNNNKVIIILCLLAVVVSLSIGFSVFSNNLIIKQGATVTPSSSDFKVLFSSSETILATNNITARTYNTDVSATAAKIDNSNPSSPSLTGLNVTFKKPYTYADYTLWVRNEGNYVAYLKSINFGTKKCTAKSGTSKELVDAACKLIFLTITFGNDNTKTNPLYGVSATKSVNDHPLAKGASEKIRVWIGYGYNANNVPVADGDFDVSFGDLTLTYSTTDS